MYNRLNEFNEFHAILGIDFTEIKILHLRIRTCK